MSESDVQARTLLAIGARRDTRLFRNTVGEGWQGEVVKREGTTVLLRRARYVTFGLAPGSHDLIGWHARLIRPEDAGHMIAQFLSLECKFGNGRPQENQKAWAQAVTRFGGLTGVVRDPADAEQIITMAPVYPVKIHNVER